MTPDVDWVKLRGLEEDHPVAASGGARVHGRRGVAHAMAGEDGLGSVLPARCWVCQREVDLAIGHRSTAPGGRDALCCPHCGLDDRMRAALHFLAEELDTATDAAVYVTEHTTPFHRALSRFFPHAIGGEQLGSGGRQCLAIADAIHDAFDVVVSLDPLARGGDARGVLGELRRMLRPGGTLLLAVPFDAQRDRHLAGSRATKAGVAAFDVRPASYGPRPHGEECPTVESFGWQLLDDLRESGFATADAVLGRSRVYGYVGGRTILVVARAPGGSSRPEESKAAALAENGPAVDLTAQLRELDQRTRQLRGEVELRQRRVSELIDELMRARCEEQSAGHDAGVARGSEDEAIAAQERWRALDAEAPRPVAEAELRQSGVEGKEAEARRLSADVASLAVIARSLEARGETLALQARFLSSELDGLRRRAAEDEAALAELARLRADLDWSYRHWQEREAELAAIRRSKTWRAWMVYLAVRRAALRAVTRPLSVARRGVANGASRLLAGASWAAGAIYLVCWFAAAWTRGAWRGRRRAAITPSPGPGPALARRPRVLVVCPYPLHPADHGGGVRISNLLHRLAESCDLHLLMFTTEDDVTAQRRALEPLVEKLYFHRWRPTVTRDRWGIAPRGAQLFASAEVSEQINQILAREAIDILQLEYTELGQYGMPRYARVKVVLTEIDIAFRSQARRRRAGMHRRYPWGRAFGHSLLDCMRQFRFELQVARRADAVHVMSDADGAYLSRFLPGGHGKVWVIPNAVDIERFAPPAVAGQRGRHLLFLGNFQHLPNLDALDFLLHEVWPLVRAADPGATLVVVGAAGGEELRRHDGRAGVTVVGAVPDAVPYYQACRALVAPIRAGSGTRLKILEALACATPVVSTTIGAEGIRAVDGEHLLLADTPEGLADAILRVLGDDELCARLGRAGRTLVESRYTWEESAAVARRCYASLLGADATESAARSADLLTPAAPASDIAVLVPTLDGGATLERCLAAVRSQKTARRVEIVCVDSGSKAADLETMARHGARVVGIDRADFDHGLTRDLAARESRAGVLVFLNQDAVPCDPDWLETLTAPLFDNHRCAAVQGGILEVPETGERFFWDSCGGRFYFTRESRRWIERYFGIGFSTVNAAIRRDVWERHPFGRAPIMEDKKWQREVVEAGWGIEVAPQAAVHHTHNYTLSALLRRCYSEGVGWRLVGETYTVRDLLADLWKPKMMADLAHGIRRREVRSWGEVLFPVLRPIMLFRGNRFGQSVRL